MLNRKNSAEEDRIRWKQIIKFAMPLTFGFLALLIATEIYGLGQIPNEMMATPFSATMELIVSIAIMFSLAAFALTCLLVKALRQKTVELQRQKENLELIVQQKTNELLQAEKLAAIGDLSARIAHDIRNPLTIIMNTFEVIKMKNAIDEKMNKHYDRINKAITRIAHQIDDVMDFVKDNPVHLKRCFFSDVISEALESISIPDNIKLKIYDGDISLDCDFSKMAAVFKNLLLNAIQTTDGNGKISIRILERNDVAIIEIEDSGPKIPDNIIPEIFDPLFTTKQEGTGLGLSVCKKIIEKHGGTINVRNNEKFGKTFFIELPKTQSIITKSIGSETIS
ncbi:MAG: sensor histidine kinase [Candidatus Nitrosotenuis sp.]